MYAPVSAANTPSSHADPPCCSQVTAPWLPNPAFSAEGDDTAIKRAFAVFQKGGVIMDVVDGEQAQMGSGQGLTNPNPNPNLTLTLTLT